jgi:3D-(3,5/4)-trihydroxycyclohexane-1,2-dione acylhydrolase (decyclizing)
VVQFLRWGTAPGLGASGEAEEGAYRLGCVVVDVPAGSAADDLRAAYGAARAASVAKRRPTVVVCRVHPTSWIESGAWWQVGVPSLSGHAELEAHRAR